MRIISQNGLHNLPYDLITIHRNRDNEIWAYTWQGKGYILGEYSTEEKAKYAFEQILIQTRNRNIYGDSHRLPKDECLNTKIKEIK